MLMMLLPVAGAHRRIWTCTVRLDDEKIIPLFVALKWKENERRRGKNCSKLNKYVIKKIMEHNIIQGKDDADYVFCTHHTSVPSELPLVCPAQRLVRVYQRLNGSTMAQRWLNGESIKSRTWRERGRTVCTADDPLRSATISKSLYQFQ